MLNSLSNEPILTHVYSNGYGEKRRPLGTKNDYVRRRIDMEMKDGGVIYKIEIDLANVPQMTINFVDG